MHLYSVSYSVVYDAVSCVLLALVHIPAISEQCKFSAMVEIVLDLEDKSICAFVFPVVVSDSMVPLT